MTFAKTCGANMHKSIPPEVKQSLLNTIQHLDHVLPGQAPIHDFVHHNTLHGFQHLPFEEAVAEFEALTGISAYLPLQRYRDWYAEGRINSADLDWALRQGLPDLDRSVPLMGEQFTRLDIDKAILLSDCRPLTLAALNWRKQHMSQHEITVWDRFCSKFSMGVKDFGFETEFSDHETLNQLTAIQDFFDQVGKTKSLRGLLLSLTGEDVLEEIRPSLIKACAAVLDEGVAAWHLPDWQTLGWYTSWKKYYRSEIFLVFEDQDDFEEFWQELPEQPLDAIIYTLSSFAIPPSNWNAYLQRLALEIPGWSGLVNWRQHHPEYRQADGATPSLVDYLAIRLILDRYYLGAFCRRHHLPSARFDRLLTYFRLHQSEFLLRQSLYQGELPEAWVNEVRQLLKNPARFRPQQMLLALKIQQWQQQNERVLQPHSAIWPVFVLCQQLNLSGHQLENLDSTSCFYLLDRVQNFSVQQQAWLWLNAYEYHYQQQLLKALHANHQRGRWADRHQQRPEAQIIFCMDDREESIRRHLEEHNPWLETLGAAGFFGMAMHYQGIDADQTVPLCPVVVNPAHIIREYAHRNSDDEKYQRSRAFKKKLAAWVFHDLRTNPIFSFVLMPVMAPFTLFSLMLRSVLPGVWADFQAGFDRYFFSDIATYLQIDAESPQQIASPDSPRQGFNDQEQADRVMAFLKNTGLSYGFAKWVVLMGHGSSSLNNPHLAAYDCGACSGRHGGPNARVFAAIANTPKVRKILAERGIVIPDDTWFVGAEHNTGNEAISFYDLDKLSGEQKAEFAEIQIQLQHGQKHSAHERCRRLASAPRQPSLPKALRHFYSRSHDFSQARPELGHATNAAAFIGRRSQTQGAFFDRRLFLISYDPTQDANGTLLEGILLAVGPVGAGINLEYYFSTVNNEAFGCGSKVPHNLTGFFAVMEGASSDLRTGLPKQMIEIHEAMRLQLVVEAKTEVLEAIYARQPALQELVGGGWVHLSSKDPETGVIYVFNRKHGFEVWQASEQAIEIKENSYDCYRNSDQALAPVLIRQPIVPGVQL